VVAVCRQRRLLVGALVGVPDVVPGKECASHEQRVLHTAVFGFLQPLSEILDPLVLRLHRHVGIGRIRNCQVLTKLPQMLRVGPAANAIAEASCATGRCLSEARLIGGHR
jgi:hypothetical protein